MKKLLLLSTIGLGAALCAASAQAGTITFFSNDNVTNSFANGSTFTDGITSVDLFAIVNVINGFSGGSFGGALGGSTATPLKSDNGGMGVDSSGPLFGSPIVNGTPTTIDSYSNLSTNPETTNDLNLYIEEIAIDLTTLHSMGYVLTGVTVSIQAFSEAFLSRVPNQDGSSPIQNQILTNSSLPGTSTLGVVDTGFNNIYVGSGQRSVYDPESHIQLLSINYSCGNQSLCGTGTGTGGGDNTDGRDQNPNPTPEPGILGLMGFSLLGLLGIRRRK